jgi:hypothetical protein
MNTGISSRLYYPDPFQPTGIEFTLEETALVTLKILDGSGKEVETLLDHQPCSSGEHQVPFETAKYKVGEYWYRISINMRGRTLNETNRIP